MDGPRERGFEGGIADASRMVEHAAQALGGDRARDTAAPSEMFSTAPSTVAPSVLPRLRANILDAVALPRSCQPTMPG